MKNLLLSITTLCCFSTFFATAQTNSSKGKDFWVGYGYNEFFDSDNSQNLNLDISIAGLPVGLPYATVTVVIDSSKPFATLFWKRVYHIPSYITFSLDENSPYLFSATPTGTSGALNWGPIPKGVTNPNQTTSPTSINYDARLFSAAAPIGTGSEGIFKGKGIQITSDVDIAVTAHFYGSVSSGATMLLPTSVWGYKYTTINSAQNGNYASDANYFYVIAKDNATRIKITPAANSRNGKLAGVPFYIDLNKGNIYQYIGYANPTTFKGVELTGSKIEVVPNANGIFNKIAVFAGSSRTGGEQDCGVGGKDFDIQQCFPENTWGLRYITTPFSNSSGSTITPSSFQQTIYKVIAKDTGTKIAINNLPPMSLNLGSVYKFSNSTPNSITANKPIMVAQFMGGGCSSGDGDPDMVYLSPLENAIYSTSFYRTQKEGINVNYVAIVLPDSGVNSLRIDNKVGFPWGSNSYINTHPYISGYKIVVIGWISLKAQVYIKSNAPFNAITYGLGAAESYAYNCGAYFDSALTYTVNGRVISPLQKSIKKATITATGNFTTTQQTNTTGSFNVELINGNYTIKPTKNNDSIKNNGISSIDVILTQKHILNQVKFNSPYKIIAADVNNDKAVSNIDVIFMKRLILGIDTTFTGKRLWAFVDSAYQFPDPTNPFPYKDSINLADLSTNKTNQTFIGVKLGDVNYDWNASQARGVNVKPVELVYELRSALKVRPDGKNGTDFQSDLIHIPIFANNFKDLTALQYTLHFNHKNYEFVGMENNKLGIEFNAQQANKSGNISFLWANAKGEDQSLEDGSLLFEIVLRSKEFGIGSKELGLVLSNDITEIEAWDKNNQQHNIISTKRETINNKPKTRTQWSASPNPTNGEIMVTMISDVSKTVVFELATADGKIVFKQNIDVVNGTNKIPLTLNKNKYLPSGLYFLKANGATQSLIVNQ